MRRDMDLARLHGRRDEHGQPHGPRVLLEDGLVEDDEQRARRLQQVGCVREGAGAALPPRGQQLRRKLAGRDGGTDPAEGLRVEQRGLRARCSGSERSARPDGGRHGAQRQA